MEILSIIFTLVGLVFFVFVCAGAYLLMRDSEVKHKVRKELREKHPDLDREQIRVLSYVKLKEMWENGDVK
jgi:predicted membrane protein